MIVVSVATGQGNSKESRCQQTGTMCQIDLSCAVGRKIKALTQNCMCVTLCVSVKAVALHASCETAAQPALLQKQRGLLHDTRVNRTR